MNIIRKKVTLMIFYDHALNEKKIKFKFYFKALLFQIYCKIRFSRYDNTPSPLENLWGYGLFGVNVRHQIRNSHRWGPS